MRTMVAVGFIFCVVILLAALSGCTSFDQTYHRADGTAFTCQSQGTGIGGVLQADSYAKQCAAKAHAAGYN